MPEVPRLPPLSTRKYFQQTHVPRRDSCRLLMLSTPMPRLVLAVLEAWCLDAAWFYYTFDAGARVSKADGAIL